MKLPVPSRSDISRMFDGVPVPTAEQLRGDERAAAIIAKAAEEPLDLDQAMEAMAMNGIRPDQTSGNLLAIMQRAAQLKAEAAKSAAMTLAALAAFAIADSPYAAEPDLDVVARHLERGLWVVAGVCLFGIIGVLLASWWASRPSPAPPEPAPDVESRYRLAQGIVCDAQRGQAGS